MILKTNKDSSWGRKCYNTGTVNSVPEIPIGKEKPKPYRLLEIVPGLTSWFILTGLVFLAYNVPGFYSYIIVFYILSWVIKSFIVVVKTQIGYRLIRTAEKEDWSRAGNKDYRFNSKIMAKYYSRMVLNRESIDEHKRINISKIIHIVVIPVYDEGFEIMDDTIKHVKECSYDVENRVVVLITYEERTGKVIESDMLKIRDKYKQSFKAVICNRHTLENGEVPGKGANISSTSDIIINYCDRNKINYNDVVVTTLDADNIMSKNYFSLLDLTYSSALNPQKASYQPTILYTNNIWEVPAVARMLAVNNTIWSISQSIRPRLLRNFSSHAQGLQSLIETNFWSKKTVVEDGHQYWRSLFAFNGNYRIVPFYATINHDAVVSDKYISIFRAQFAQIRRWAYGVSDVPYVAWNMLIRKSKFTKINFYKLTSKFIRLMDTHITWSTNSFIILLAPSLPAIMGTSGRYDKLSSRLPNIAGSIQTLALLSLLAVLIFSLVILPKKPSTKPRSAYLLIVMQWILSPLVGIIYGSGASLYSQTRLMLGRYYESFEVTQKKR